MCTTCFKIREQRYMCFDEHITGLIEQFDNIILDHIEKYKPKKYSIPALIKREVLVRCGYFQTGPNQLTVAAHADINKCSEIIKNKAITEETSVISDYYLTPAACLHIYPMLENKKITKPTCITTKARVYRYEDGDHSRGERLWDFTVREIVFVGEAEYVQCCLQEVEDWLIKYSLRYGKRFYISKAYDNFYDTKQNRIMQKIQKKNNFKREFILDNDGKEIALASFNFHNDHFSKPFSFDNDGNITTGCVGFGLERWILVFDSSEA